MIYYYKMMNNNIFDILLFSNIKQINKIIIMSKNMVNSYLWKLLYTRKYQLNNFVKTYYYSYINYGIIMIKNKKKRMTCIIERQLIQSLDQ